MELIVPKWYLIKYGEYNIMYCSHMMIIYPVPYKDMFESGYICRGNYGFYIIWEKMKPGVSLSYYLSYAD